VEESPVSSLLSIDHIAKSKSNFVRFSGVFRKKLQKSDGVIKTVLAKKNRMSKAAEG
jgi:hypothetical protein